jgi:phosphatidylglycerophosphate synthase
VGDLNVTRIPWPFAVNAIFTNSRSTQFAEPSAHYPFVAAAVCVQLRLLCNLLDGMVAIEGGKSTASGALFNEIPDRLADALFLVPLGYASGYLWLGWLAALLAVLTAYIRVLGGALGQPQNFGGILPKQRRMAVLTVALLPRL